MYKQFQSIHDPRYKKNMKNPSMLLKERIGLLLEILESERKYVKYLNLLYDGYYQPLVHNKEKLVADDHKDNLEHGLVFQKKAIAPDNVIKHMFPENLTTIIRFNRDFLDKLEQRFAFSCPKKEDKSQVAVGDRDQSGEDSHETQAMFNLKIGDIFKKTAPFFKVYVSYLAAYERSMSVIRMQKANSKQFESWLKNRKKMSWSEGLDIASLLIMPCQRTPRYQILLQNLLENTPYDHGDYDDLVDAVQLVKECAEYQNAKIRETNNKMKVHQLSKLFNLPDLIKPSRRLVREGDLFLKNSKHKQRAYLFNDLLLVREMKKNPLGMTSRSSPVHPYSLLDVNISQETPQTLCVTFADDNGRDFGEFEMIFDSEQLKDDWKYDLKAVLAELNSKKEYIMQTQPDDARQMKQMSRLSLGSNRNPTQSNIAELRKSVSVEKLFR